MEHVWSILAQDVLINDESKAVSLIGIIERITLFIPIEHKTKDLPILPLRMSLVSMWARSRYEEAERGRARVAIKDPDAKTIKGFEPFEYDVELVASTSFRFTAKFRSFPFTKTGFYQIIIQRQIGNRWREVAILPIEIIEENSEIA
jgi:hypothetical protein